MAYKIHIGLVMGVLENVWPFTFAWNLSGWGQEAEKGRFRGHLGGYGPLSRGLCSLPQLCVL